MTDAERRTNDTRNDPTAWPFGPAVWTLPGYQPERQTMIPRDKQLHLAAGALVGIVTAAACIKLGVGPELLIAILGAVAGAVVGYAKELYDKKHPDVHTYDMADARFTALGGLAGGLAGALLLPLVM